MLNTAVSGGISLNDPSNVYVNRNKCDVAPAEEKRRRFDLVELSDDKDTAVPKDLVGRISKEVRTTTTIGDIERLRKAVAEGTYFPDPIRIAGKMLFHVED